MNIYYTYVYLDPRKEGNYIFGDYIFKYEPFYIGKGKGNRLNDHLVEAKRSDKNSHKLNIIRKIFNCGLTPIIEKIHININNFDAKKYEIELIKLIGRCNKKEGTLTNLTDGGEGTLGIIQSEETKMKRVESLYKSTLFDTLKSKEYREKLSKIVKEKMDNPITRKKLSESQKGEKNSMYGKKSSDKQKNAVRQAHKDGKIKLSEEGRNRIIESNKTIDRSNYSKRDDSIRYILSSPSNETFVLKGNTKLQIFCSEYKIQFHLLKKNYDTTISEKELKSKNKTAINTIGWHLTKDISKCKWGYYK